MSGLIDELRDQLQATYRIDAELGGGGMSRVFRAEEVALRRPVVLKVLPLELAHTLSTERFEREIRVAARLQHPHIVPLLAAGRAGEALFYTMPLVDGESLRAYLDTRGELPVSDATRLFREVADALAYAHREGVIHRDIKPDNILLSHHHAMVTDFGVARAVAEAVSGGTLTQTGMAVGTPAYMAPEQAGASATDQRTDIYALGLVAYEMLAGHAPFNGATPQSLIAAHMTQTPPPLGGTRASVSPALAAIVHRCLEKRAADRFQSADELVAALDQLGTSSSLTGAVAPISRRTLLSTSAALGLAAAGFGGGMLTAFRVRPTTTPSYHRLTFRRGMIRTARFSADEKTILYGALWDGDVSRVHTVRADNPESSALALPPATPLAISSTGELALALGTHYRGIMTYGTLARVPLAGGAPRELQENVKYADWSPDGQQLALIRLVGDRDQLEYPAGNVIAQGDGPTGGFSFARVSPSGDTVAAFALPSRTSLFGRVVVVDRSGKTLVTSAPYANVFGLAWNGDDVWFTAADQLPLFRNTIYAMTRSGSARVVARVPGNTSLHDIAADGRLLIARTDDRGGMTVRAPGDVAERDLSWQDASVLADLSADGRHVLFSETGVAGGPRGSTYLRGLDASPAIRLGDGAAQSLSPDGRWAIVSQGAPHLDVIPTGAGETLRLARPGLVLLEARWLPDGRNVIARARTSGNGASRLYLLGLTGQAVQAVTPEGVDIGEARWVPAPDGARVGVSLPTGITMYSVDGAGSGRKVPGLADSAKLVGWTQRGLLVSGDPFTSGRIDSVDPDTGARSRWEEIRMQDPAGVMNLNLTLLSTTPDGRGYGYTWHRALSDLYVVEGLA